MSKLTSQRFTTLRVRLLLAAALFMFALLAAGGHPVVEAAGAPSVNGLFYGDGDYLTYIPYATSENGSHLYIYFQNPTLYVALVVDNGVNDNVFAPQSNAAYTQSSGWPSHRSAKRAQDSEFAQFELRCANAPNYWSWQQGYAGLVGSNWLSNENVGGGDGAATPPAYTSASSFAWNINTYNANPAPAWDMYALGTVIDNWKSPFDGANPNSVVGLDGFPNGFSTTYQWEWAAVYEWSVDLTVCGSEPVFVVAGSSHHSPSKISDENDIFPEDPSPSPLTDYGDLPDSYSTLETSNGAAHVLKVATAYLGTAPDPELDGQPSLGATGDALTGGDDEDGVARTFSPAWQNDNTVTINLNIQGAGSTADVGIWIDWDGDGVFQADEFYPFFDLPVGGIVPVNVLVPGAADYSTGSPLNVRVRIFDDAVDAPGGSLDAADFAGLATSGEVEDYRWEFGPTAISVSAVNTPAAGNIWPVVVAIFLLALTAVFILRRRPVQY